MGCADYQNNSEVKVGEGWYRDISPHFYLWSTGFESWICHRKNSHVLDWRFSQDPSSLWSSIVAYRPAPKRHARNNRTVFHAVLAVPQGCVLCPTLYSIYIYIYKSYATNTWRLSRSLFLMTSVYMRQTAKKVMFSESCSEVSVLLRRGVSAGWKKLMMIRLRPSNFLINLSSLRLILHWKNGISPLSLMQNILVWSSIRELHGDCT
jgi:hypothetical protein